MKAPGNPSPGNSACFHYGSTTSHYNSFRSENLTNDLLRLSDPAAQSARGAWWKLRADNVAGRLIINYRPFYQYLIIAAVWLSGKEDGPHTGSLYIGNIAGELRRRGSWSRRFPRRVVAAPSSARFPCSRLIRSYFILPMRSECN